jgi:hypothetical protein
VKGFWIRQDVMPMYVVNGLEIVPARVAGEAFVEFVLAGPLAPVRQPHVLHVPEPPDSAGTAAAGVRREYLNDPMLEVIAVHEAFPGHYVHVEASLLGPSVMRTCIPSFPAFTEGWAHYVEELAIERGLSDGRPLVRVAQLKAALEAAMRLLVYLSVHMRRWTFTAAAEQAAALCDWSPERAAREVLVVTADPAGAMYTLGKLHIRRWRRAVGTTDAELRHFHDRLLRCGAAPLSTAWRYYLDGQRHGSSALSGSGTVQDPSAQRTIPG